MPQFLLDTPYCYTLRKFSCDPRSGGVWSLPQIHGNLDALVVALVQGGLENLAITLQGKGVGQKTGGGKILPGEQIHRHLIGALALAPDIAVSVHGRAGEAQLPEPETGEVHRTYGPGGAHQHEGAPGLQSQEPGLERIFTPHAVK